MESKRAPLLDIASRAFSVLAIGLFAVGLFYALTLRADIALVHATNARAREQDQEMNERFGWHNSAEQRQKHP